MIRFAILTAVSKKKQAKEDKASLKAQEDKSRHLGLSKKWKETAGPYRIPGASRSFYVDLSVAEGDIPQLKQMLDDAKAKLFDVLIIYSYDRLGDLADMIAQSLRFYGVQLLSVSQSVDILPPEEFNPYASDSEENMRILAKLTQRYRIAMMRRKYTEGMQKRISLGLYTLHVIYGYRKINNDSKSVPVQNPKQAKIVSAIKDLFLSGQSSEQITKWLNEKRIPTPKGGKRWHETTVEKMLLNPFYAGKVVFAKRKTVRDPRNPHAPIRYIKNPNPLMAEGKHKPIYSWADYLAILAEFERRSNAPNTTRHPYSGILTCAVCGSRLYHMHDVWRCKYPGTDHIALKKVEANYIIPHALQKALQANTPAQRQQIIIDDSETIADLEAQRKRIQQGYEKGIYTIEESGEKIAHIEKQIKELHDKTTRQQRLEIQHQQFLTLLNQTKKIITALPEWIKKEDPKTVSNLLQRLCKEIIIHPNREVTIHFRS